MRSVLLAMAAATILVGCQTSAPVNQVRLGEWRLDWPHQESDLTPDAHVRYGRLPNGMRYALVANSTPSNTVSLRMRFDVGSLMEDDDQRGLAHFLEHMAFNGTTNVPEGDMIRLLERQGLAFGAHTNAYTSFNETVYSLEAPNARRETLETSLFLFRELASNMTIAGDAVDRERGVVLSELRSRGGPQSRAHEALQNFLFPGQLLSARLPIGTVETISGATPQRLRDLYEDFYRPDRTLLVVVGQIDVDAMEAEIQARFGDWRPARPDPGDPDVRAAAGSDQVGYYYEPGLSTQVSLILPRSPRMARNDTRDVERLLLRSLGESIVSRRLARLAEADGALIQGGAAGSSEMYDAAALSSIAIASTPENWREALAVGDQELRRALEYGFTDAELEEQIRGMRRAFQVRAERMATRPNTEIAAGIVGEFGAWGVLMSPDDERALFERLAPRLTLSAVRAEFRRNWTGDPKIFVRTGQEITDAQRAILQTYSASTHLAVSAPHNSAATRFAYGDFGAPGAVVERHEIADLGITNVRFANNVRLNLKRTEFSDDQILVDVRFGSGLLEFPMEAPGLTMLAPMLTDGGLEAHSADELRSVLAGRNVRAAFAIGPDSFSLSGATTQSDLALQLQLLTAYLTHPGFREAPLTQWRQALPSQYASLRSSPTGVASQWVPRLLRSGDPRYGMPSLEQAQARSLEEFRSVLARAMRQGGVEIGIVGDFDVDTAIAAVAATLGALPVRSAAEPAFEAERRLVFAPANSTPRILHHDGDANRALAHVFWPTEDDSDSARLRTLRLLHAVLRLKLVERIREAEGATYSPNAQEFNAHANPGFGYLGVSLDLRTEDVDRFYGIVDEIAASIAAGNVSADELERARRPLLEALPRTFESNSYWLSLVARAQTGPEFLDAHRTIARDYNTITMASVVAAARIYLRPERAVRISVLPDDANPSGDHNEP